MTLLATHPIVIEGQRLAEERARQQGRRTGWLEGALIVAIIILSLGAVAGGVHACQRVEREFQREARV